MNAIESSANVVCRRNAAMAKIIAVVLAFVLLDSQAHSNDIVATKDLVSYVVTLDSISPALLPYHSGATATVQFTVNPKDPAKFSPKKVTMYVAGSPNSPFTITGVETQGTYTVNLTEGSDLTSSQVYQVYIVVDNATSSTLPVTVWQVVVTDVASFPADQSRQTIGIGEIVNLAISPLPDSNTEVDWSLGDSLGTVSPQNGSNTTFTASQSPSTVYVTATIDQLNLPVPFLVVAPSAISVSVGSNVGYGTPGQNYVGALTVFNYTYGPTSVNFSNALLRESVPQSVVQWPNGKFLPATGPSSNPYSPSLGNLAMDNIGTGETQISYLSQNGQYINFQPPTISWFEQYQNAQGDWINWGPQISKTDSYFGSDQSAMETDTGVSGSHQGPWQ